MSQCGILQLTGLSDNIKSHFVPGVYKKYLLEKKYEYQSFLPAHINQSTNRIFILKNTRAI